MNVFGLDAESRMRGFLQATETVDKRQRLKRQGSMLKTMFCATVRASRLVSAVRYASQHTILHGNVWEEFVDVKHCSLHAWRLW